MTDATPPWEPPIAGTEVEHLLGALDRQRWTFRYKADGLDAAGLAVTVGASSLTLGGLLKHLALVEDHYLTHGLAAREYPAVWSAHDGSQDWPFASAADDAPQVLYRLYDDAVARSRAVQAEILGDPGAGAAVLDAGMVVHEDAAQQPSRRRMLVDLLEEYARHVGHADLLREAVDGRTGEDPPPDWRPSAS